MGVLIGAALALFSVAVVVYPLLRARRPARDEDPAAGAGLSEAEADPELDLNLESIYDAIRTLRLEHQLGQVPNDVYSEQLRDYRLRAAASLRQRAEEPAGGPEWLLEQEVLLARAALRGAGGPPTPCAHCGAPTGPGARCPECGHNPYTPEPPPP